MCGLIVQLNSLENVPQHLKQYLFLILFLYL